MKQQHNQSDFGRFFFKIYMENNHLDDLFMDEGEIEPEVVRLFMIVKSISGMSRDFPF